MAGSFGSPFISIPFLLFPSSYRPLKTRLASLRAWENLFWHVSISAEQTYVSNSFPSRIIHILNDYRGLPASGACFRKGYLRRQHTSSQRARRDNSNEAVGGNGRWRRLRNRRRGSRN